MIEIPTCTIVLLRGKLVCTCVFPCEVRFSFALIVFLRLDCDDDGDAGIGGVLNDAVDASLNVYASTCFTSSLVCVGVYFMS